MTAYIPVIAMGFSSILLQIISLRQLLATFSGNELDIGITLAVWLSAVGIGSFGGHRFRFRNAFAFSFIGIAFLIQPTILAMNLIRPLSSMEFGESIPLSTTFITTIMTVLPLCLLIGAQFPLAVSFLKENFSKAYSLEAAGAFVGGSLFTVLISGRVSIIVLAAIISFINVALALALLRKKVLMVLIFVPLALFSVTNKMNMMLLGKGYELVDRVESRYGEITVLKIRDQFNIYSSGKLQFSYPDPQTEELSVHLPMSIHPSPNRLLLIGGSPALIGEFLKYPISRIDFVEIDPEMITVSAQLLSTHDRQKIRNRAVRIFTEDARKFVNNSDPASYDMIILNISEPATANINRFYTIEFFIEAEKVLKEDGILSLSLPTASGYMSRRLQMANGSIYNSMKQIFSHVSISSEEYGYLFASNHSMDTDPRILIERFNHKAFSTHFFKPYILHDAFAPLKITMVQKRLEKVDSINVDRRPVAYLYNLMLWSEIHAGRLLIFFLDLKEWQIFSSIIMAFLVSGAIFWRRTQALYYSIFTAGFSIMAFSLILILTYQASFGYVYEMIGLLTALFMIGMACGASIIRKMQNPMRALRASELGAVILFLSSPLFFEYELVFYLLSLLCGMIGGMQYVLTTICKKEGEITKTAGRLYGIDLAGSFFGALMTTVLLIPLLGVHYTLFLLIVIKSCSFILLLSIRYEKA